MKTAKVWEVVLGGSIGGWGRRELRRTFTSCASIPVGETKHQILEKALTFTNRYGWTNTAIIQAAEELKVPVVAHGLFPRQGAEIAEHWMRKGNDELRQHLASLTTHQPTTTGEPSNTTQDRRLTYEEIIVEGIYKRLLFNMPYRNSWPQAMALGLRPSNLSNTMTLLSEMSAIIHRAAVKASLSNEVECVSETSIGLIYAASELYFLTDFSQEFMDTKVFIRKKLERLKRVEDRGLLVRTSYTGMKSVALGFVDIFSQTYPQQFSSASDHQDSKTDDFQGQPMSPVTRNDERVVEDDLHLPNGEDIVNKPADEVVDALRRLNPTLEVLVTHIDDTFEPIRTKKVLRLLVSDQNIVLDTWRS